jgi:hypothetical protein
MIDFSRRITEGVTATVMLLACALEILCMNLSGDTEYLDRDF